MTPFVWMFIKNYENLRKFIIENKSISSLIQLEYSAFQEATVPICTFVLSNLGENYNGTYLKLSEFTGGMDVQKEKVLQIISGDEVLNDKNKFFIQQSKFNLIPGNSIVYWVSNNFIKTFELGSSIDDFSDFTGSQNITANNIKYLRYFWEINNNEIGKKWIKYAKGGPFKKYYGNLELVVDWSDEARNFYSQNKTSNLLNEKYWFKEGITYTDISSKGTGFRYLPPECVFDKAGPSIVNIKYLYYCLGLLNTKLTTYYLNIFNPTLHIQVKDVKSIPIIIDKNYQKQIENLTLENISLSKEDWDENETSFNFKKHFLLNNSSLIKEKYNLWIERSKNRLKQLKQNEEELNSIFLEIYGLSGELNNQLCEDEITLSKRDLNLDIKSFVSYVIGCMFGRYSLDNDGLQYAGGDFNLSKYHKFIPDDDNIIPVLDSEYFEDDIVGRFVEFVKTCFGQENLEENLDFIANALAKNKKPSREKIREYLLKNFFNDHKKTYKKCPIYWQFSSGKENGFNCLIYMHRYEPSLVARIRTDYLHKTQKAIEQRITTCDNIINHSSSNTEITKATKDKNKLQKQLKETQKYDEALAYVANQNIKIDLDDGVKVNYAKFQNIEVSKEGEKTKKVNLLKKL